MTDSVVPADYIVPLTLTGPGFRLEPLGPQHNDADHRAWTSSIDHIRATPGFPDGSWPVLMSVSENLRDLERHAEDFRLRRGFTYTVRDANGEVIGCVYIYPSAPGAPGASGADVRSWVSADHAALDVALYQAVSAWLRSAWPFTAVRYAPR